LFESDLEWRKAGKAAIILEAKEICTFPYYISSVSNILSAVAFLISWMEEVVEQNVLMSKLAPLHTS
jgi:hypothetical protein